MIVIIHTTWRLIQPARTAQLPGRCMTPLHEQSSGGDRDLRMGVSLYRRAARFCHVEGLPAHARRIESGPSSLRPSACTIVVKGKKVDARSTWPAGG